MRKFRVEIDGKIYEVKVEEVGSEDTEDLRTEASEPLVPKMAPAPKKAEGKAIIAPMMGTIIDILVNPNDEVKVGQTVAKLEAMKLEMDVVSEVEGIVKEIHVKKGDSVQSGDPLISFE